MPCCWRCASRCRLKLPGTLDRVTVNGETIDFKGGYNLDRCLEYDRFRNRVEAIDSRTCEGLRGYQARQAAAEEEKRRQADERQEAARIAQAQRAADQEERRGKIEEADKDRREREAHADAARAAEWPARLAKLAEDQARDERRAQLKKELDACLHTDAYAQHEIRQEIQEKLENLRGVAALQALEREIQRASGVRSLTRDYELGREKVEVTAELQASWREYKQRGGKGARPEAIPLLPNPCAKLETDIEAMKEKQ